MKTNLEFSKHASERIKFRKISKKRVLEVIQKPDKTFSSFRIRKLLQKRYGAMILEVIAKFEKEKIIIVTAYYLAEKNESKIRSKN